MQGVSKMKFFNTEPYDLEAVKQSLSQAVETGFIRVLEQHHDFLEESIDVLLSKNTLPQEKQLHLVRFLHLIAMHANAEEETLYVGLKNAAEKLARVEGAAAQDEHEIAMQLSDELKEMGFERIWSEAIEAKSHVIAGLVQNHIEEEEREIFKTAENQISDEDLDALRDQYIEKCKTYLDEEMGVLYRSPLDRSRPSAAL